MLDNVDQTHLELASGKLVLQKTVLSFILGESKNLFDTDRICLDVASDELDPVVWRDHTQTEETSEQTIVESWVTTAERDSLVSCLDVWTRITFNRSNSH